MRNERILRQYFGGILNFDFLDKFVENGNLD